MKNMVICQGDDVVKKNIGFLHNIVKIWVFIAHPFA